LALNDLKFWFHTEHLRYMTQCTHAQHRISHNLWLWQRETEQKISTTKTSYKIGSTAVGTGGTSPPTFWDPGITNILVSQVLGTLASSWKCNAYFGAIFKVLFEIFTSNPCAVVPLCKFKLDSNKRIKLC